VLKNRSIATLPGEGGRALTIKLRGHSGAIFIPSGS